MFLLWLVLFLFYCVFVIVVIVVIGVTLIAVDPGSYLKVREASKNKQKFVQKVAKKNILLIWRVI